MLRVLEVLLGEIVVGGWREGQGEPAMVLGDPLLAILGSLRLLPLLLALPGPPVRLSEAP